jgi:cholesterol transport system auxiliary component
VIRPVRLFLAAGLALSLGGCVSLLPKSKPAQLYSFVDAVEAKATPASGPASAVVLGALTFPRAATSDALLTRTGAEAAYISEARWTAPAQVLFREAVERAFDKSGRVRILGRGELGQAAGILRIEVRTFETRYAVKDAIPTVAVVAHARLTRVDGTFVDARDFEAETPATENRVGPIVEAYRTSTAKALGDLTAWLETNAPPPAARPATSTTTTTQSTSTTTTTVQPAR